MLDSTLLPRVVAPEDGQAYHAVANLVIFKATAATTNGAYALFEAHTAPGQGVPPHRQRYEEEALWILEGSYRFLVGVQQVDLGPGSYVFVPRGTVHAYTNTGAAPGRLLILVSPGGIHERFFAEVGEQVSTLGVPPTPPDVSRLSAVAAKYGIEFLPPEA
jgi:quercetin dioxygenase-like cupin family protein